MKIVTIRDLRDHGGQVVDRVLPGENLIITRSGKPVAELRPMPRPELHRDEILARWRALRAVDAEAFRRDIDSLLDPTR